MEEVGCHFLYNTSLCSLGKVFGLRCDAGRFEHEFDDGRN